MANTSQVLAIFYILPQLGKNLSLRSAPDRLVFLLQVRGKNVGITNKLDDQFNLNWLLLTF